MDFQGLAASDRCNDDVFNLWTVVEPTRSRGWNMNFAEYVDRVEFHLERLKVVSRPNHESYVAAWNNQIPARKMAESYKRRAGKMSDAQDTKTTR